MNHVSVSVQCSTEGQEQNGGGRYIISTSTCWVDRARRVQRRTHLNIDNDDDERSRRNSKLLLLIKNHQEVQEWRRGALSYRARRP